MSRSYSDPIGGSPSSVGPQIRTDYYQKKALIEMVKEQVFSPLADVTAMPKNMGKTIKRYHYMPLLDDRNINDQGLDAAGAVIDSTKWEIVTDGVVSGNYASEAAAITAAGTTGATVRRKSGFLYGSSKDIGTISAKLPPLTENGGRVNRVGFTRIELEGTLEKFGFFDTYTQESVDFDTDSELQMHIHREMLRGANEMTEAALQVDLLNGAGVVRYCGLATQDSEVTGVAANTVSEVSYDDLMKLAIELDDNRTPKNTKIISGSRMIDTRVVNAARALYCASALRLTIEQMTDYHGKQAFIPVAQYASAGTLMQGEIGSIGDFRIIIVQEMAHWAGLGADEGTNAGYRATSGKYDIYPMLVVGDGSFTTIGFQTDGKTTKFTITHKPPGKEIADLQDPFGETGFMSIKWYYGSMILRSERLAVLKTVAKL
jgi:N4-gp56 family major capsid protein